jgi:AcrR family transcriptional regulator
MVGMAKTETGRIPADDGGPDDETGKVVRRAPFSDNPEVGARGQRTQQRIVDAALQVFGERGYHQCSVDRITKLAGCSRVSFYQYFSSKEDLFRHLTGQVARQLSASIEALGTLTADDEGWATMRAWVGRHTEIYERYEPVFDAFQAAVESDETIAGGSVRIGERNVERIRSRLGTVTLPPRRLDPVIGLLMETLTRTQSTTGTLRTVAASAYPKARIDDAVTDVMHRSLFGLQPDVNVHPPGSRRPPLLEFGPVMQEVLQNDGSGHDLTPAGKRTLEALMQAGRDVFVQRGYHRTRVDDIVEAAGVSHGAFYRYFRNKDDLAHVVAGHAMRQLSTAVAEIPPALSTDSADNRNGALRWWLRRYNAAHAPETALIQVWVDAARQDPTMRQDSAAVIDWGRRRMVQFLGPREFGDPDREGVVMLALLTAFGSRTRSPASIDAAAYIIEHGLLGR